MLGGVPAHVVAGDALVNFDPRRGRDYDFSPTVAVRNRGDIE